MKLKYVVHSLHYLFQVISPAIVVVVLGSSSRTHAFIHNNKQPPSFFASSSLPIKNNIPAFTRKQHVSSSTSPINKKHSKFPLYWFFTDNNAGTYAKDQPQQSSTKIPNKNPKKDKIVILENIGSGSYGTVHYCQFLDETKNDLVVDDGEGDEELTSFENTSLYVAKRAWTLPELKDMLYTNPPQRNTNRNNSNNDSDNGNRILDGVKDDETKINKKLKEKLKRCNHYLNVEEHCLQKIKTNSEQNENEEEEESQQNIISNVLPNLIGRFQDNCHEYEWLVFEMISSSSNNHQPTQNTNDGGEKKKSHSPVKAAAKSLNQVMLLDWKDQHTEDDGDGNDDHRHHLSMIYDELGLHESHNDDSINGSSTFEKTLDVIMESLLNILVQVHGNKIVHRDLKPDNLLIDRSTNSLILIDFGSAADMEPVKSIGGFGKRVGLDDTVVAVSPIYAAPETFVKLGEEAFRFDVFSAGLIFCQLMFNLLDERTDAAFRQQLQESSFDLDLWLERELQSTIRPAGFDDGMLYLSERVGLWNLLKDMLQPEPYNRVSSQKAIVRYKQIMTNYRGENNFSLKLSDGTFFESVIENIEVCTIPDDDNSEVTNSFVKPRPLHYVLTFDRKESLGLILSEPLVDDEVPTSEANDRSWKATTRNAQTGEVFVRDIVKGGQADKMGMVEVGDRLIGVGDFPFTNNGFEGFLEMLEKVPGRAKSVKVHFDRQSITYQDINSKEVTNNGISIVSSYGAFTTKGRRKSNEDAIILQEIQNDERNCLLIGGVFDGHGGDAASRTASQILPSLLSTRLKDRDLEFALKSAWDETCDTYKEGCSIYGGSCVAEYDPREGILLAGTGAKDLIAGTTASVATFEQNDDKNKLVILNCGDSRTLVVGAPKDGTLKQSFVHYETQDHSPKSKLEADRLQSGRDNGLDYSLPECSVNRWWIRVGDYQYAVSRSLEGAFATSKGIVSDADIDIVDTSTILNHRESASLISASDGLFEVYDNEFIAKEVSKMRQDGVDAKDAAKILCMMAQEKGTTDNVSVIIWYFD